MKEEEILKQLNSLILEKRYYTEYHAWVGTKTFEAIQGLLDLYEKEKQKNNTIEAQKLRDMCYKIDGNYISKDKIREKVIEIKNKKAENDFITTTQGKLDTIIALESLLEEE